jgi:hypothetical protein
MILGKPAATAVLTSPPVLQNGSTGGPFPLYPQKWNGFTNLPLRWLRSGHSPDILTVSAQPIYWGIMSSLSLAEPEPGGWTLKEIELRHKIISSIITLPEGALCQN